MVHYRGEFGQFCQSIGAVHITSSPYFPQSKGQAESTAKNTNICYLSAWKQTRIFNLPYLNSAECPEKINFLLLSSCSVSSNKEFCLWSAIHQLTSIKNNILISVPTYLILCLSAHVCSFSIPYPKDGIKKHLLSKFYLLAEVTRSNYQTAKSLFPQAHFLC